jgi:hypothetical protein
MQERNFNLSEVKNNLNKVLSVPIIREVAYLSGGIVPYILSGNDSNRKHGDIEFVVDEKNMEMIRQCLQYYNVYDAQLDSVSENQNIDYGVTCIIGGIPVEFYPFKFENNLLTIRTYSIINNNALQLKERLISNAVREDFLTEYKENGNSILKTMSLEAIRFSKEQANRNKDLVDIREIDRIGYDKDKYQRVGENLSTQIFNKRIIETNVKKEK